MLKIDNEGISIKGSTIALMAELTTLIRSMLDKEILTEDDLDTVIRYTKMSDEERMQELENTEAEILQSFKEEHRDLVRMFLSTFPRMM